MSRKYAVFLNIMAKWLGVVVVSLLQLIARRVFINYYTDDLLGLSSLLQSVISMLSLLELGIGSAIYYSLYEPLANGNKDKIAAIMALYKKIYSVIGLAILIIGISLIPFLGKMVNTNVSRRTLYNAYMIILMDSVLSYFWAYRRNIINADQREYICTNIDSLTLIFTAITQIIVTIITGNYYLYLAVKVLWTLIGNIIIFIYSGKKYVYLNQDTDYKLSKDFINVFKENVKALCIINISTYLVFGTDNLLLNSFAGLGSVFIYSNYHLIITTVNKIFHNIFNSAQASVGNYFVKENIDDAYTLFNNMFFGNYIITCFTTVALASVFNNFMELWLGKEYVWPLKIVIVLALNNYLRFIGQTVSVFRNAAGIYNPYPFFKYWPLVEGCVNILASLIFVKILKHQEVLSIFLGTIVSTTTIFSIVGPHSLFKYCFGIEKIYKYIKNYFMYFLLTIVYMIVSLWLSVQLKTNSLLLNVLISIIISVIVPNVCNLIIFYKNQSLLYYKKILFDKLIFNSK